MSTAGWSHKNLHPQFNIVTAAVLKVVINDAVYDKRTR
jgi:hypothetical protein